MVSFNIRPNARSNPRDKSKPLQTHHERKTNLQKIKGRARAPEGKVYEAGEAIIPDSLFRED